MTLQEFRQIEMMGFTTMGELAQYLKSWDF